MRLRTGLMDQSRHKSVETLRGYVRDADKFTDHAGEGLAGISGPYFHKAPIGMRWSEEVENTRP